MAFTRALRASGRPFNIIGVDGDTISLQRSLADENIRVPLASEGAYIDILNEVIEKCYVGLVTVQLEAELLPVSENRDRLNAPVFLPKHETIETGFSKWASYEVWKESGISTPESLLIENRDELGPALDHFGGQMWMRGLTGTGGKGSLPVKSLGDAQKWFDLWEGKTDFMAAQLLGQEAWSWESVWDNGKLIVGQARRRLRWEFKNLTMSGITGIAGASETVTSPEVEQLCIDAVLAIDPEPHGVLGLDISFDDSGKPYVTEVNAGRFMSGGSLFFAEHGLNLAEIAIDVAAGNWPADSRPDDYRLRDGLICISGMDTETIVTSREELNAIDNDFAARLDKHTNQAGAAD